MLAVVIVDVAINIARRYSRRGGMSLNLMSLIDLVERSDIALDKPGQEDGTKTLRLGNPGQTGLIVLVQRPIRLGSLLVQVHSLMCLNRHSRAMIRPPPEIMSKPPSITRLK